MPFTLAHPAAVLVLARGPLSLIALCAGAVAPDLPYYFRSMPIEVTADSWYEPYVNATSSHLLGQLLPVALPLALVVYLCVWLLLPPMRSIAGVETQATVAMAGLPQALTRGAWIVVSLVIGVLTHLLWDELTEFGGSASAVLQHGSTILGLVILAVVAYRRRSVIRWHDATVRRNLFVAAAFCALGALVAGLVASRSWWSPPPELSTGETFEGMITSGVKGAGVGLVAAAAVLALVWWIGELAKKVRPGRPRAMHH